MIGVRLDGRLGNQLFQYAFAISLSKKYNTFYIIDNDYKVDYVKKYFKTIPFLNNAISRGLFKKYIAIHFPFIHQKNNEPHDEMKPLLKNNQFYKGFFQSELFFKNIVTGIQKKMQIKKVYKQAFAEKYGHLFKSKKVLVIHYRLCDYITWGNNQTGGINMTLPESYYLNALQQIKNLDDYTILLVSDDMENAAGKLSGIKNKIIISDSEIMDFQLLMHADKLIISNSSFAWWAAYLNKNDAETFAPEHWLGFKVNKEIPLNVIPAKFTRLPVYDKTMM